MNIAGKWMELEMIIFSELPRPRKANIACSLSTAASLSKPSWVDTCISK